MTKVSTASISGANSDEAALIAGLIAGDDSAFCTLITRYQSTMLAIARAISGDTFAEDVVQDAWLSIHNNIGKFEGKSSLKTWMITIVSNQAKGRRRHEARRVSLDELDGETPGSYLEAAHFSSDGHWSAPIASWRSESPEQLLEEKQLRHCLNKTLNILPAAQRAAFILREIEQESFTDICTTLEISAANVRVLVHRARLTLMQVIDRFQETGKC